MAVDELDRRLSREEFLRRAAVLGGAGVLAGVGVSRAGAAGLTGSAARAESGSLQVLDWSGYEVKDLWKQYAATHPDMKPKFTFMTNEADALGEDARRPQAGPLPPVRRLGEVLRRRAASSSRGTRR